VASDAESPFMRDLRAVIRDDGCARRAIAATRLRTRCGALQDYGPHNGSRRRDNEPGHGGLCERPEA